MPFPFVVNGQTFQPGRYTIEQDDQSRSLLLIRVDRGSHAARFVTTNRDVGRDPAGRAPRSPSSATTGSTGSRASGKETATDSISCSDDGRHAAVTDAD